MAITLPKITTSKRIPDSAVLLFRVINLNKCGNILVKIKM